MSDDQFDIIKEFVQNKFPNNVSVLNVGAES